MLANLYPSVRKSKNSARLIARLCIGLFLFVFCTQSVFAEILPLSYQQSASVRAQTVEALKKIKKGRWDEGRTIIAATRDPLASKIYYWMLFSRKNSDERFVRLAQFIRHNPEWPGMRDLRLKAEKNMPNNLALDDIVEWFADYPPLPSEGMDRYLQTLITQGQTKKAQGILENWWADTPLDRASQITIYKKYNRLITRRAHERRFDMLLFAKQYTNARAIAAVLGKDYQRLAEARIALAADKGGLNALINKVPPSLRSDPGLVYERLHWRRTHDYDEGALEILNNPPSADKIQNKEAWWHERHIMAQRLIEQKKYKQAYALVHKHMQKNGLSFAQAEWLSGWLALRFLNKPTLALQHFEALYNKVSTPMSKARTAYWAGRASAKMKVKALSAEWYKKAALYQTVFYGQMAGAELGMEEALPNAAPPELSAEDITKFKANELLQAAQIFHDAGIKKESSQFIKAFVAHEKTPKAYRYAAELAAKIKQYEDAVRIAKNATREGLFLTAQSYPVMTDNMRYVEIEWALAHAIMRQESLFDIEAQSPAGARGLMQLMPGTAKGVAKSLGLSYRSDWLTNRPDYNVRLGSKYLQDLLIRFGGSYPLAIAAYNAGPNRVEKWIKVYGDPRLGHVDMIDWMEMIPIYETRNYVQRVMENVYIYRLRLKTQQPKPQARIHLTYIYGL